MSPPSTTGTETAGDFWSKGVTIIPFFQTFVVFGLLKPAYCAYGVILSADGEKFSVSNMQEFFERTKILISYNSHC